MFKASKSKASKSVIINRKEPSWALHDSEYFGLTYDDELKEFIKIEVLPYIENQLEVRITPLSNDHALNGSNISVNGGEFHLYDLQKVEEEAWSFIIPSAKKVSITFQDNPYGMERKFVRQPKMTEADEDDPEVVDPVYPSAPIVRNINLF